MRFWSKLGIGVCVAALGVASAHAQQKAQKSSPSQAQHFMSVHDQKAFVDNYCSDCHNPDEKSGSMTLTDLDLQHPELNVDLAEQVIRKAGVGMMPPPGAYQPDLATRKLFVASLANDVDTYADAHPWFPNPPLHRMNRVEYANSVKELLGVTIDADDMLPSDDMSHGFDNMAGVLTLSPALMESYISAAGKISREALGERHADPGSMTYEVPRVVSQVNHVDGAPFGTRGGISVVHDFPADGMYTFKLEFYYSLDGPLFGAMQGNTQSIEVSINGQRAALFPIDPRITKFKEMRTPPIFVKAGPQRVSAAFLKTADGPVDDVVEPVAFSLLDLNQATLPGLSTLPHLHTLTVTGPTDVTGISETPSREMVFSCYPHDARQDTPCAREIATRLATQAYRRPVGRDEVDGLMKLYALGYKQGGFESGVGVMLQAILASPSFIYRFERDRAQLAPAHKGYVKVGSYTQDQPSSYPISDIELASRLSYFLWSAAPDRELVRLAAENKLHRPEVLRAQVHRMLMDPRSMALSNNFASEWLHLQNLKSLQPDGYLYPGFDRNLGNAMREETVLFFNSIVHDDRSVLTLLDGHYTFVNQQLAHLYGIPNIYGNRFRRVEITDPNRYGLLGQASILALTSGSNRTSPVIRGKYVMEVLLGTPPPPPPPNVPALADHGANGSVQTVRERLEEHRKNPVCAGCHQFMDPIGFALENYNPIGGWRSFDSGLPIDATGKLFDGTPLNGPVSLRDALLKHSDAFIGTFTESLYAYGMGRVLVPADMPDVREIEHEAAAQGNTFSAFVMGIVTSEPFLRRSVAPAPILPKRLLATIKLPGASLTASNVNPTTLTAKNN